jgi:hypothetical protein
MIFKNKFSPTFLIVVTLNFILACGKSNSSKSVSKADNIIPDRRTMIIDTFSNFPPEIDGCSCYFSSDSTEFEEAKYIYVNDYAQTSFLKINGVLTKFTQTEFKEIDSIASIAKANSDKYDLIIEIKYLRQSGYETFLNTGTFRLTDKKGKTIIKTFYGECGC